MGTPEGARKGHNPEADAKRAEAMRKRFEDPEYRARHAKKIREARARMSAEKKSEAARKSHTAESDAKRRESMQEKWGDPEYRAMREALEATPAMKKARSDAMKVANNDSAKRQQHSEHMKEKFASDDEFRTRHAEGMRQSWSDPKVADARADAMRKAWLDHPEAFTKSLAALRKDAASIEGRMRRQSVFARRAAAAPTTPHEHVVCLALNEMNIPYMVHVVRVGKELDIFVPSLNLDIEVDGVNHSGAGIKRDADRDTYLKSQDYKVLRIKHRDIENGSFITRLQEILKK